MAAAALSVEQQINQLNDARKLVLSDANYYPRIIQGILPIVNPPAKVELRRWVADFIAETFASPTLPPAQKETLSLIVLEVLKSFIENPAEDPAVVKSVVQAAASIYPHVFRWILNNSYDSPTWDRMLAIKSRILRIWDTAAVGIRICCIKFAQRVVLVQTKGPDADPRRGDPMEVSLSMVPETHPLIPPKNLEAEASGLLDRLLAVFQENSSDAVLVDATLNSLSLLIRARAQLSNKILTVILNFNPLKQANSPMTPKTRVMVKSMEKTTRQLLIHIVKRDQQHPLAGRIQQYVERMMKAKADVFDEASRKRGAPEVMNGPELAKRQKVGGQVSAPVFHVPPLTPGSHTISELFTVTADEGLKAFDVSMLAEDIVLKIAVTIMQRIDAGTLAQAVEGIRQRYQTILTAKPEEINAATALLGVEDDDDDYEPDYFGAEDTEQILNKLDQAPPEEPSLNVPNVDLGHFALPPPPRLSHDEAAKVGQGTISRVFGVMHTLDERGKKSKAGVNRLAASNFDRDAWITIISRLATRASAGLEEPAIVKADPASAVFTLSHTIRETLCLYVLEDFRKRMDIAIAWLCEEWYNDRVQLGLQEDTILHYEKWVLKVLDGFVPYLDGQDRALVIKFLGDIPALSVNVLERVKGLCRDPATVNMALQSLLYLVAFRPPVRGLVLDAVEDVWESYEDARPMVVKLFAKWRPDLGTKVDSKDGEEKLDPKLNGDTIAVAA